MTTLAASTDSRGFFAFYREYAQTGIHAATAAALTGFIGLASFISPWFLAVAIGVYALPPIYFYLNEDVDPVPGSEASSTEAASGPGATRDEDSTEEPGGTTSAAESTDEAAPDSPEADPVASDRTGGETPVGSTASSQDELTSDSTRPGVDQATVSESSRPTGADTGIERENDPGPESESETDAEDTEPATDADIEFEAEWTEVDSPVAVALHDAVASADGAYAAGDGGVVLARRAEWETVLEDGPAGDSNALRGIDCAVSADGAGEAVLWVAGDSGAVGRYDPAVAGIADFSAPKDQTSTWTDLAVTGAAGAETVHLVNGSGAVIRGQYDEDEGSIAWGELDKPGSGSSITGITFRDRTVGYLCDSSGEVYRTEDGGESYEALGEGNNGVAFRALAPVGSEGLLVAGEDGSLFQYDGSAWTRRSVSETPLRAIDTTGSDAIDVAGIAGDGAGTIYEDDGEEWNPTETAVGSIAAVAIEDRAVAIGDGGEILERQRRRES